MGLTYSPLLPTSQLLGVQWAPNVFTVVTAGGGMVVGRGSWSSNAPEILWEGVRL